LLGAIRATKDLALKNWIDLNYFVYSGFEDSHLGSILLLFQQPFTIFIVLDRQYICVHFTSASSQEATQQIELEFEYVTGGYHDGGKLFKKQKLLYLGSQS
jgi:hypothetical protein